MRHFLNILSCFIIWAAGVISSAIVRDGISVVAQLLPVCLVITGFMIMEEITKEEYKNGNRRRSL